ncbi:hypothetical protein IWQ61_008242 [Dispira simplex]|nr:hypothetical protein IWQ61_008242 [Dispira simplex]
MLCIKWLVVLVSHVNQLSSRLCQVCSQPSRSFAKVSLACLKRAQPTGSILTSLGSYYEDQRNRKQLESELAPLLKAEKEKEASIKEAPNDTKSKVLHLPEKHTLQSLNIHPVLIQALRDTFQIHELTHMQGVLLHRLLHQSQDVILRSQTGTGKSFAFVIYLLDQLLQQGYLQQYLAATLPKNNNSNGNNGSTQPTPGKPGVSDGNRQGVALLGALNMALEATKSRSKFSNTRRGSLATAEGLGCLRQPSAVFLVPNNQLAYQVGRWTHQLLMTCQKIIGETSSATQETLASPRDTVTSLVCQILVKDDTNGTTKEKRQVTQLEQTIPWLVIATPTRLTELVDQKLVALRRLRWLILDEVDHLLRLPSRYATMSAVRLRQHHPKETELLTDKIIGSIQSTGPNSRSPRTRLFVNSATINRTLRYFMSGEKKWIDHKAIYLDASPHAMPSIPEGIVHHCLMLDGDIIRNIRPTAPDTDTDRSVERDYRPAPPRSVPNTRVEFEDAITEAIAQIALHEPYQTMIVFVDNQASIQTLVEKLDEEQGLVASEYQPARTSTKRGANSESNARHVYLLKEFSARGLDIPNVTHVVITHPPDSPASFLHMAGRTGRMGRKGKVITIMRAEGRREARLNTMYRHLGIQLQPYELVE